jgi:hypothetical protein
MMSEVDSDSAQTVVSVRSSCLPQCMVRATESLTRSWGRSLEEPTGNPTPDIMDAVVDTLRNGLAGPRSQRPVTDR